MERYTRYDSAVQNEELRLAVSLALILLKLVRRVRRIGAVVEEIARARSNDCFGPINVHLDFMETGRAIGIWREAENILGVDFAANFVECRLDGSTTKCAVVNAASC